MFRVSYLHALTPKGLGFIGFRVYRAVMKGPVGVYRVYEVEGSFTLPQPHLPGPPLVTPTINHAA